jgi:hypothetical protein
VSFAPAAQQPDRHELIPPVTTDADSLLSALRCSQECVQNDSDDSVAGIAGPSGDKVVDINKDKSAISGSDDEVIPATSAGYEDDEDDLASEYSESRSETSEEF